MDTVTALTDLLRALDPTIPVIMLTGNTDGSVAAETLKLGPFPTPPKPLNLRYLDHLIATFATKPARAQAPEEAGGRGMDRMKTLAEILREIDGLDPV